jgi:hypothetical protein
MSKASKTEEQTGLLPRQDMKHSTAVSVYQQFAGRDHYSCGEDGWEAVADPAMGLAGRPAPGRP